MDSGVLFPDPLHRVVWVCSYQTCWVRLYMCLSMSFIQAGNNTVVWTLSSCSQVTLKNRISSHDSLVWNGTFCQSVLPLAHVFFFQGLHGDGGIVPACHPLLVEPKQLHQRNRETGFHLWKQRCGVGAEDLRGSLATEISSLGVDTQIHTNDFIKEN